MNKIEKAMYGWPSVYIVLILVCGVIFSRQLHVPSFMFLLPLSGLGMWVQYLNRKQHSLARLQEKEESTKTNS
jgi:cytochrome b subunit of formate dehydrogenase